ncbi:MAG: LPS export ABC transporter periplasmic protein LptC [Bdellovibrionia bacterium]
MAGLLFAVLMVEVLIFSPKEISTPDDIRAKKSQSETPEEQHMEGASLVETSDGRKEWELKADEAKGSKEKGFMSLKKVNAKFFSKSDGTFFNVTGDRGSVWLTSKDMEVQGNVVIHSSNGHIFKTNSVYYKSGDKALRTSDPVTMVGPKDLNGDRLNLEGKGLYASIDDGFIDIQDDVRVKKTLDDGRNVAIRSTKARFSSKSKVASFKDDVTVDIASTRITGPEAHFEYDSKTQALTSMQVDGGVRISDVDKWATAKKVHMSFTKDRFVLNGAPRLVQNNDELRGEEIIFLDGGKTVQVRRAKAKFEDTNSKEFP